jgi:hypothetical protein
MIYLILSLFLNPAKASDEWLCNQQDISSVRHGNLILSCGEADGFDVEVAREKSFQAAVNEFKRICDLSSDCKDHKVNVEAKRTTCVDLAGEIFYSDVHVRCYRLVVFTIVD